jgi:hypothetical protein
MNIQISEIKESYNNLNGLFIGFYLQHHIDKNYLKSKIPSARIIFNKIICPTYPMMG